MTLLLFIVSILFIKGFNVGFALALIGIVNFAIVILKSLITAIEKSKKEEEAFFNKLFEEKNKND